MHVPVCKEEVPPEEERSSSLLQEEPQPPHIKEEQEELLQRAQEAGGSTLTLLKLETRPACLTLASQKKGTQVPVACRMMLR